MFDSDIGRFDQVFAPTAQLHGLRDGNLRILPAAEYRKLLASNPSPKSKNAPRQQEILLVDFAGQGKGSDRYTSVRRLSFVPPYSQCVAHHR